MDNHSINNINNKFSEESKIYLKRYEPPLRKQLNLFETEFIKRGWAKLALTEDKEFNAFDVGIGAGRIISTLSELEGARIFGIDISQEMIDVALNNVKDKNKIVKIVRGNFAESIPFEDNYFDFITAIRCLKYNENWKDILINLSKKLKKNGILVFTMINVNHDFLRAFPNISNGPSSLFFACIPCLIHSDYLQPWVHFCLFWDSFSDADFSITIFLPEV